jgi:hypothetical protein
LFSAVVAIGKILRCAACLAHTNQIRDAARRDTSTPMSIRKGCAPFTYSSTDLEIFLNSVSALAVGWKMMFIYVKYYRKPLNLLLNFVSRAPPGANHVQFMVFINLLPPHFSTFLKWSFAEKLYAICSPRLLSGHV